MALPPAAAGDAPRVPREITYIIDTSGSMEGVSIAQARDALLLALDRLQPGDRFNVIEFNSMTRPLFAAPVAGRRRDAAARPAVRRRPRCPRRHRNAAGARRRAQRRDRIEPGSSGGLPDRRRGGQRGRAAAPDRREDRRPAPVHRRHRSRTQRVFHDPGRAVRPRHLHLHRRRARSEGEDDRAVPQAGKPGADRHRRRLAGRRRRLAASSFPTCTRANRSWSWRSSTRMRRAARSRCPVAAAQRPGAACCPQRRPSTSRAWASCGRGRRSTR